MESEFITNYKEVKKHMIRAEVTIFGNKSEYCHYLENRANDIVSILLKNNVDVTRVTFQEENREEENSCYICREIEDKIKYE